MEETMINEERAEKKSGSILDLMTSEGKSKGVSPKNLGIVLIVAAVNVSLLAICLSHLSQLINTLTNTNYVINDVIYSMVKEWICVICSLFAFAAFVIPWKYKKTAAIVITIAAVAVRILA